MKYEHVYAWTKCMNSISGKVACINWILSSPDGSRPASVKYGGGAYNVYISGCLFARVRVYDVADADTALERLAALYDGLWYARRGMCEFTNS